MAKKKEAHAAPAGVPRIIRFTNLLHELRDSEAQELKSLLDEGAADSEFVEQAQRLIGVFKLKQELSN